MLVCGSEALLERETETHALTQLMERARQGAGALCWVEGEPGIGKTALMTLAKARASAAGFSVLAASGDELEREFAFGVTRQLLEPVRSAQRSALNSILAGSAERSVVGEDEAEVVEGDRPFQVLHGLFWFLANLAADGCVLLAVDDAQWCDEASLRWLHFLTRRLDGLPVVVLVAARPFATASHPLLTALERQAISRLALAPLSQAASAQLVGQSLENAAPEFCRACYQASRGNPFLLRELVTALAAQGVRPDADSAGWALELGPQAVSRAVLVRLQRLGPDAAALAAAAAVFGDGARLRDVAALAGLSIADAQRIGDAMRESSVLASVDPVGFVHSVVRSAIYADLPEGQRAEQHSRAARQLVAIGAAPETVAAQLLRAAPEGSRQAVEVLRRAARRAAARGATDTVITYLRRALAEPPVGSSRAEVLGQLGTAEAELGDPAAIDHLVQALETPTNASARAKLARRLAAAYLAAQRFVDAVAVLDATIDRLNRTDRNVDLVLGLEADLAVAARMDLSTAALGRARIERIRLLAGQRSAPEARRALVQVAVEDTSVGKPAAEAVVLATRALGTDWLLSGEDPLQMAHTEAVLVLLFADRYPEAEAALDAAIAAAQRRGSLLGYLHGTCFRAMLRYRQGNLREAEADARISLGALDEPIPHLLAVPLQVGTLVEILVERGELDAADDVLRSFRLTGPLEGPEHVNYLGYARGLLRLAQGRSQHALDDLLAVGHRQDAWGMPNPAIIPWRSAAAHAAIALGRTEQAARLANDETELARAFGAPRTMAISLRTLGLTCGGETGLSHLHEAAAILADSGAELEHARALTDLGAALRRANRRAAARRVLDDALPIARRCHATTLAQRAATELTACGGRSRKTAVDTGLDALTTSELRVARLASQGLTNRQIAQSLFITIKTVEDHLGRAYRKLGITTRTQLHRMWQPLQDRPGDS